MLIKMLYSETFVHESGCHLANVLFRILIFQQPIKLARILNLFYSVIVLSAKVLFSTVLYKTSLHLQGNSS